MGGWGYGYDVIAVGVGVVDGNALTPTADSRVAVPTGVVARWGGAFGTSSRGYNVALKIARDKLHEEAARLAGLADGAAVKKNAD